MIDLDTRREQAMERHEPLTPVLCALCGYPVSHMTRVTRAMAGGMCTRDTCMRDSKDPKKRRQVFTFNRLVNEL